MAKSKDLDVKRFFFIIAVFLITTDLAILFNIPVVRQIMGFLFLTMVPGLLLLHILQLNNLGYTEKFVLSVGISVSFLMLFGLLINNLMVEIGYETPLSMIPLLISFNCACILLGVIGYKINKKPIISIKKPCLNSSEKAFLIFPVLFPALSIFGMYIMNTRGNNIILLCLLILIPAYIIFVSFFNQKFRTRLYPVVIYLIGISLLLMISLRSSHIIGMDTHLEYYFFHYTLDNSYWSISENSTLDACLSISLLPTVYQTILQVPPEFLFKILYSLLFSISPLVVYIISKKYIGDYFAFLASFFFMSQLIFLETAPNARTNIAILFFALVIMVIFHTGISNMNKRILSIIFAFSCVVSHYATTYTFFFILLFSRIGMQIIPKFTMSDHATGNPIPDDISQVAGLKKIWILRNLTWTFVLLFFVILFFWYSQITITAFDNAVDFIIKTVLELNRFFLIESRSSGLPQVMGKDISSIPQMIKFAVYWLTIVYIGIGVLYTIVKYKKIVALSELKENKVHFLKSRIEPEFFIIILICIAILIGFFVIPYISRFYNMQRIYFMMMPLLSMFFIMGGIILAKFLKLNRSGAILAILLLLIPNFLCTTDMVNQMFVVPVAITLNAKGSVYDYAFIHDEESYSARWLYDTVDLKGRCIFTDFTGDKRLISQGGIYYDHIDYKYLSLPGNRKTQGYIYLRYYNVVNGKLFTENYEENNISESQHKYIDKSKIYNNGGSEVWK